MLNMIFIVKALYSCPKCFHAAFSHLVKREKKNENTENTG